MIGKFEELALMATMRAGPKAHAAKIYAVFEESSATNPQFAALYTSLDRLTKKGMLSETTDPEDPRSKRLFTITAEGRKALDEALQATAAIGGFVWGGFKGVSSNG